MTEDLIDADGRNYVFRLPTAEHDRCADCDHLAMGQKAPGCERLDIEIADPRRSRCPGHTPLSED